MIVRKKRTKKIGSVHRHVLLDRKVLSVVSLLVILGAIFISGRLAGRSEDIRSLASVEDDVKYCVNQPSCCNDIINQKNAKGDISDLPDDEQPYHACDWPIRGYCQLSICGQLPPTKKYQGECGWYWIFHDKGGNSANLGTNTPNGYGCMVGDSEATMRAKYGPDGSIIPPPAPTSLPAPTSIPVIPTDIPVPTVPAPTVPAVKPPTAVPIPTNPPRNNTTVIIVPTAYTAPSPTFVPTPTNVPVMQVIGSNIGSFFEKTKESFLKFISVVLP